jgi:hypothetical protein
LEFREKRTSGIRLKIDPVAILPSLENLRLDQGGQFPLETGGAHAEVLGQIAEIPPAIGVEKRRCQDGLPDLRKEGIKRFPLTHNT